MLQLQRHAQYRQQLFTPTATPSPAAGAWVAVLGRLRGTGSFDLTQVPRKPALHIIQSGSGWLETGGGPAQALASGDAFLIVPGEEVRYREDPQRPWRYTWLGFDGPLALALLRQCGFPDGVQVRRKAATPALWRLCDEAEAGFAAAICSPFLAPALAFRIADALHALDATTPSTDPAAALRLVIDAGYDGDLTIGGAASRLGVDRSTLFRRFRAAYGCGPRAYLTQVRIERARALLRRGTGSVTAIAAACGYDDHRAFARAYRARYGVAPSAERKALRLREPGNR